MKKILFVLLIITCLIGCSTQKYGCDYKGGHVPKFRADIQVQGKLEKVLYHTPGRAILQMALKDTTAYIYYSYFRGLRKQRFVIGDKYTIQYNSNDTAKYKRSVVKLNS